MSYFDPRQVTKVPIDYASPVGLGALLVQNDKVICYPSRVLSDVETRYSQSEKINARSSLGRRVCTFTYTCMALNSPLLPTISPSLEYSAVTKLRLPVSTAGSFASCHTSIILFTNLAKMRKTQLTFLVATQTAQSPNQPELQKNTSSTLHQRRAHHHDF